MNFLLGITENAMCPRNAEGDLAEWSAVIIQNNYLD
jgi:hypothetical protein